jgi:hypothetical protein
MNYKSAKKYLPGLGKDFFLAADELSPVIAKAFSGDLVFVTSPATTSRQATNAGFIRQVDITLQTAAGEVHEWYCGSLTVTAADTSAAGTIAVSGGTGITFNKGKATVILSGSATAWLAGETNTLTVPATTILGYTVASKTSVETITA